VIEAHNWLRLVGEGVGEQTLTTAEVPYPQVGPGLKLPRDVLCGDLIPTFARLAVEVVVEKPLLWVIA